MTEHWSRDRFYRVFIVEAVFRLALIEKKLLREKASVEKTSIEATKKNTKKNIGDRWMMLAVELHGLKGLFLMLSTSHDLTSLSHVLAVLETKILRTVAQGLEISSGQCLLFAQAFEALRETLMTSLNKDDLSEIIRATELKLSEIEEMISVSHGEVDASQSFIKPMKHLLFEEKENLAGTAYYFVDDVSPQEEMPLDGLGFVEFLRDTLQAMAKSMKQEAVVLIELGGIESRFELDRREVYALTQAVIQLMLNTLDYSGLEKNEKLKISISLSSSVDQLSRGLIIHYRDNGKIASDEIATRWEKSKSSRHVSVERVFSQADHRDLSGNGLGAGWVRKLLKSVGASIECGVDEGEQKKGASFRVLHQLPEKAV